jgi:hypothetical protein
MCKVEIVAFQLLPSIDLVCSWCMSSSVEKLVNFYFFNSTKSQIRIFCYISRFWESLDRNLKVVGGQPKTIIVASNCLWFQQGINACPYSRGWPVHIYIDPVGEKYPSSTILLVRKAHGIKTFSSERTVTNRFLL